LDLGFFLNFFGLMVSKYFNLCFLDFNFLCWDVFSKFVEDLSLIYVFLSFIRRCGFCLKIVWRWWWKWKEVREQYEEIEKTINW
jgi:hypothetical protein